MDGPNAAPLTMREERLLHALAGMAAQYLESDGTPDTMGIAADSLDCMFMGAGEDALEVLAEHGLVTYRRGDRVGEWTNAGREFLRRTDI